MKTFDVEPRVAGTVHLGGTKRQSVILAGRMAEKGNTDQIFFDASDNFVVFEVGKRGSGKSYGMGSLLEGFATSAASQIGKHQERRAVVMLDPLDIHWPALTPLRPDGPDGVRKQYQILTNWGGLEVEPINVRVFVPAGHTWPIDPPEFREFRLPVSFLHAGDWGSTSPECRSDGGAPRSSCRRSLPQSHRGRLGLGQLLIASSCKARLQHHRSGRLYRT